MYQGYAASIHTGTEILRKRYSGAGPYCGHHTSTITSKRHSCMQDSAAPARIRIGTRLFCERASRKIHRATNPSTTQFSIRMWSYHGDITMSGGPGGIWFGNTAPGAMGLLMCLVLLEIPLQVDAGR